MYFLSISCILLTSLMGFYNIKIFAIIVSNKYFNINMEVLSAVSSQMFVKFERNHRER